MLNAESLRLAAHLDRESGAEQTVSVKEMASFSSAINKARDKRTKKAKTSRTMGLFSWLGGAVSTIAKKGVRTATKLGLAVPFDKDIERLSNMKRELNSLRLQMEQIRTSAVPRLLARKQARTDLIAQNLSKAANQAKFELEAAIKTLDSAQSSAQQAKRDIANGKLPAQASGVFIVRKQIADKQYASARRRGEGVRAQWVSSEQGLAKEGVPTARAFAAAAGQSVSEFGSKTGSALAQFGETAEQTVREVGKGAKSVQPILKYWPYALGAAALLYGYALIPKSSPSKE